MPVTGADYHLPVMGEEAVRGLVIDPHGAYLDGTMGGGGHSRLILAALAPDGRLVGLDRDGEAVERNLGIFGGDRRVTVRRLPFSSLGEVCPEGGLAGALFDLGVSSRQLDDRAKGFSFAPGTALDMRMDAAGPTAADLLRDWDEDDLAAALRRNSDLEGARRVARALKAKAAGPGPLDSDAVREALGPWLRARPHQSGRLLARVFQALRMEVNGELAEIGAGLAAAVKALRPGGRLAVLSYHSVEDRKVKETAAAFERDCLCPPELPVCACGGGHRRLKKVLRKPLEPSAAEARANPRARSAKLRVWERVGGAA